MKNINAIIYFVKISKLLFQSLARIVDTSWFIHNAVKYSDTIKKKNVTVIGILFFSAFELYF